MELAFGILISVVQLAVFIGLIVFVVKLVTKRGASSAEGSGVSIRHFFQYSIMLVMLTVTAFGVIGLVDAIASAGTQLTRDTSAVARSIAFVVVGLPVYAGLVAYTRRRLATDPVEARALGWIFYLTVALIGSLIATMSFLVAFAGDLLGDGEVNRTMLISSLVWGGVWAVHWWVAARSANSGQMQVHLLLGSATGLVTLSLGAGAAMTAALSELYDALLSVTSVDMGVENLVRGSVLFGIGALVWVLYWIGHARGTARTPTWLTYVLLVGVLGGAVTAIVGAAAILFGILDWIIGDVDAATATAHFAFIPGAVAALAVGTSLWAYHRSVLGDRRRRARTEIDRVYDYLLAGAGLLVAAGGLATLIAVALEALGSRDIATSGGSRSAVAITLLVIGVPLWWRHWSTIRRFRAADPQESVRSVTRRAYLFLLFGAAGIVAVIDLLILVFLIVEDLLEGTLNAATVNAVAVPVSLLITAGAVAWYHFTVFREDRSITPQEKAPALREIIVVGSDEVGAAITSGTGVRVVQFRVVDQPTAVATIDDVLGALDNETHERIVVVAEDGRFRLLPIAN
jgi:hypothetical protein